MVKFIKVTDKTTDPPQVGFHNADDDYELPDDSKYTKFEVVDEAAAREGTPALFGVARTLTAADIDEQIAALQELREAQKASEPAVDAAIPADPATPVDPGADESKKK
ncbi:hypothetical protein [Leifsonia sp. NPDC058248]|uniref:hypothetical protein n=1 Tax=Leifsonia sp. NPDC058248 TaxID=3346402 RepID=UPI0036DE8DB5